MTEAAFQVTGLAAVLHVKDMTPPGVRPGAEELIAFVSESTKKGTPWRPRK
jgi:hypothetical protein